MKLTTLLVAMCVAELLEKDGQRWWALAIVVAFVVEAFADRPARRYRQVLKDRVAFRAYTRRKRRRAESWQALKERAASLLSRVTGS